MKKFIIFCGEVMNDLVVMCWQLRLGCYGGKLKEKGDPFSSTLSMAKGIDLGKGFLKLVVIGWNIPSSRL
jgi:hypothetical protein